VDDVLAIARSKVTDEKTLDDVLKVMKKDSKYSSFFEEENSGGKSTGASLEHKRKSEKNDNYGARLAKGNISSGKKSSYFS
jgi:hypothetical protein